MSITIVIGNYQFMGMLHEDGVAAFAIICYLFPVIYTVAQSAQPIISYNYGAKLDLRVSRTLHLSLLTAATCGRNINIAHNCFYVLPQQTLRLFESKL